MDVKADGAGASRHSAALGSGAAAVTSRRTWAVVNRDSQYQKTVLVTRWRWYAAWWAASLRILEGDDMRIVRLT